MKPSALTLSQLSIVPPHSVPVVLLPPVFPDAKGENQDTLYFDELPAMVPHKAVYPGHTGLKNLKSCKFIVHYTTGGFSNHQTEDLGILEDQPEKSLAFTFPKQRLGNKLEVHCSVQYEFNDDTSASVRSNIRTYTVIK